MPYTKKQLAALKRFLSAHCVYGLAGDHYIVTDGCTLVRMPEPLPEDIAGLPASSDVEYVAKYLRNDESYDHVLLETPVTSGILKSVIAAWKEARKQSVTGPHPVIMLKSKESELYGTAFVAGFNASRLLTALDIAGPKARFYLGKSKCGHPSLLIYGAGDQDGIAVLVLPLNPKYWKEVQ